VEGVKARERGPVPEPRNPTELRERALQLVTEAVSEEPDLSLNAAVLRNGPRALPCRLCCRRVRGADDVGRREAQSAERKVRSPSGQRDLVGGLELLRAGA
jgi:hypothetical protein